MAVINSPWVGIAKGRLGQGVYYNAKGQTVARSYNPQPLNRRTISQQSQRAVFSSAVKFFSRGVQNLFNFAFENKAVNESDYNAYMRYNAKRGMYFGPEQNESDIYPSLGDFVMTRGSLGTLSYGINSNDDLLLSLPVLEINDVAFNTLGELSSALINAGYMQGDIFTFVVINTSGQPGSPSAPLVGVLEASVWTIRQFSVDVASSLNLNAEGFEAGITRGILSIELLSQSVASDMAAGVCCVVSRVSNGKVYVSNSDLLLNWAGKLALRYGRSSTWQAIVMAAWQAEEPSILQGRLRFNQGSGFSVTATGIIGVRVNAIVENSAYFYANEVVDRETFINLFDLGYSVDSDTDILNSFMLLEPNSDTLIRITNGEDVFFKISQDSTDPKKWNVVEVNEEVTYMMRSIIYI